MRTYIQELVSVEQLLEIGGFRDGSKECPICVDSETGALWLIDVEGCSHSVQAVSAMGAKLSAKRKKLLVAREVALFLNSSSICMVNCFAGMLSFLGIENGDVPMGDQAQLEAHITNSDPECVKRRGWWIDIVNQIRLGDEF